MGYRNRVILSQANTHYMFFIDYQYADKLKKNNSNASGYGEFKKYYKDALQSEYEEFEELAEDIEHGIFEATTTSLSKQDLIDVTVQINELCKEIQKTPFDLTIHDFISHKMAANNILCGFALIRWINKWMHLLFPLFNPSSFCSYFNKLIASIQDVTFDHLRMSLLLKLLTDGVDHSSSINKIRSIQLNNWIGTNGLSAHDFSPSLTTLSN